PGEGTLLFKALMKEKPERDEDKVREFVNGLKPSAKQKMLNSERLRDIVAELRAEANKGVDEEELFAGLDEMA
ncbi:hypothetical protein ACKI1L_38155, partial [Streptomyces scabiei]|uniref:hypothetical protein n=1 Tax=Streptomyces scabiei TaxID=1930 RepID=UPI0038F7FD59